MNPGKKSKTRDRHRACFSEKNLSADPINGSEILLDGLRMQWMCTTETEGFNRNDPKAGFWTNQPTGHNKWSFKLTKVSQIVKSYKDIRGKNW